MQSDPEGFIRSLDADTGPDADNPRACGVALLLCMLRKGSSHVAEAMLSYANHLQVWYNSPQLETPLEPFTLQASYCKQSSIWAACLRSQRTASDNSFVRMISTHCVQM